MRHVAARGRHRSRRVVAQSGELLQRRRLPAFAGTRPAALRASRRHARRARPYGARCRRSRAAPVRHGRSRSARRVVAGGTGRSVPHRARARLRARARRLEPTARPLSRRAGRHGRLQRGSIGVRRARVRRRRRRAGYERRRRVVPNAARGGVRRFAGARPRARPRRAQGHRRLERRAGAQADAARPRARCGAAGRARPTRRGVLLHARVSRAAHGASAAVPRRDRMGAGHRRRADAHVRRLDGQLLRDQLLGSARHQRALRFLAGGVARRLADRRPSGPRSRRSANSPKRSSRLRTTRRGSRRSFFDLSR